MCILEPTEFFKKTLAQLKFTNARVINELTGIAHYHKKKYLCTHRWEPVDGGSTTPDAAPDVPDRLNVQKTSALFSILRQQSCLKFCLRLSASLPRGPISTSSAQSVLGSDLCTQYSSFPRKKFFKISDLNSRGKDTNATLPQTWNLSKILHSQIFRLKILHRKSA